MTCPIAKMRLLLVPNMPDSRAKSSDWCCVPLQAAEVCLACVSVPGMLIRMLSIRLVPLVHSPVQRHCMT